MAPQHNPEHKHGLGLVEEKESPFIYGHVWVWDTIIEKIDRGDEGQKEQGTSKPAHVDDFQSGQTVCVIRPA